MEFKPTLTFSFLFILTIQSYVLTISHAQSIIKTLSGFSGDLPFKLETGYVGIGEKDDVQLFYYFIESTTNPNEDPLIIFIPGGPGASGLMTLLYEVGPLKFNLDDGLDNLTLKLNPYGWTQMASIVFIDIPAGNGFSYAETKEGWTSSDSILATQANEFIKKFLIRHPKFLKNPLYTAGISYIGIVLPKITLEIYEGNERGDQPFLNIQGYIIFSPFTDKFSDFNSRFEYAHRMALISDGTYKRARENCNDNYINADFTNAICADSLHAYEECTSHITLDNILEDFCDVNNPLLDCEAIFSKVVTKWANMDDVQQALNIRQGKIGKWELLNSTMHYQQGKNDTLCYSYDFFSSVSYHKQLSSRNCQALIMSGDHDMTFPYVGIEQWISSLNLEIAVPWKPFYVDGQVGGYETKYAQNDYSLTFATLKGAGHLVPSYKPKETFVLTQRWFSSHTYSSDT